MRNACCVCLSWTPSQVSRLLALPTMHDQHSCESSCQQGHVVLAGIGRCTTPFCLSSSVCCCCCKCGCPEVFSYYHCSATKSLCRTVSSHASNQALGATGHGRSSTVRSATFVGWLNGDHAAHVCVGMTPYRCVQILQGLGWCMCASPLTGPLLGACCVLCMMLAISNGACSCCHQELPAQALLKVLQWHKQHRHLDFSKSMVSCRLPVSLHVYLDE